MGGKETNEKHDEKEKSMTEKKRVKKHLGTKGMRLWKVKLTERFLDPNVALWIVTRSRNLSLVVAKSMEVISKEYPGRLILSIDYMGTIGN
jgi:hypothetical protein